MVMALRGPWVLIRLALLTALGTVSCSPVAWFSMPPSSAGADVVLDTYLRAIVAGDCADARRLTIATFVKGNGELCGDVSVSDYKINPEPARPGATEAIFATTLTTGDSADGSIRAGSMTWFYQLLQQPDGSWRITGGGSGP